VHIIFSTKNRIAFLQSQNLRSEVHAYLVGTLRALESESLRVGGIADHVHILAALSRKTSLADLVSPRFQGQCPSGAPLFRGGAYIAQNAYGTPVLGPLVPLGLSGPGLKIVFEMSKLQKLLEKQLEFWALAAGSALQSMRNFACKGTA
jgi:hypothetical protein